MVRVRSSPNAKQQTTTKGNDVNPVWNEKFTFYLNPEEKNVLGKGLHSTTQHNTTQHNTTQHNTTQHNTTQHNTTQHNTTQHNKTQYSNTTQHHNTTQRSPMFNWLKTVILSFIICHSHLASACLTIKTIKFCTF